MTTLPKNTQIICRTCVKPGEAGIWILPIIRSRKRFSCKKKKPDEIIPQGIFSSGPDKKLRQVQITRLSSHLPRMNRAAKHSERNSQSRYMPIQMLSSLPLKHSTIR